MRYDLIEVLPYRRHLPKRYSQGLPRLEGGPSAGLPRVYDMALETICHGDGRVDAEGLSGFVAVYQTVSILQLGELWAIPIMLRLVLIENLRRVAARMATGRIDRNRADYWADQMTETAATAPKSLILVTADMARSNPPMGSEFVADCARRLQGQSPALALPLTWIEQRLAESGQTIERMVQLENQRQAADQVSMSNSIGSLRFLEAMDWREFVETMSSVEKILREDPGGVYGMMDFASRDRYRHVVETIAKQSRLAEHEVARRAIQRAQEGAEQAEKRADDHAALLSLLSASHLAVALVNWVATLLTTPYTLPRLDFSGGMPPEARTLVVIPTMLTSAANLDELVEGLEVRFLANRDENLHFGLLTDFRDAHAEVMPEDEPLLRLARQRIEALNETYGSANNDRFFLFHRPRRWNPHERLWMGYERKRGKLAELNALLRSGAQDRFSLVVGETAVLSNVKYVITLDTDTQLPRDTARQLVGTMAHPLHRARYDEDTQRVCEGYGILQPRLAESLPGTKRSRYARLCGSEPRIDPYTRAVSDVYQDLFQEGSFIGKGIYEIDAFERALNGRFPENRILSHDLVEGGYARSGLLTDVQLYEAFPSRYDADVSRRHRWIRGDWQLARWVLPRVPMPGHAPGESRRKNPLSLLSRWKIVDNLRRSLVPAALTVLLLLGWTLLSPPWLWTLAGLGILLRGQAANSKVDECRPSRFD